MRRVLILARNDTAWRAAQLERGLAAHGFEVRCSATMSEPSPDVVVCVGWETLAAAGRPACPVVLDLPLPRLAGEAAGPELKRRTQEKVAVLRMADYFTCAGPRQQLYFRSWLAVAKIPHADTRLAVVPAGPGAHDVVPAFLAPECNCGDDRAAVAALAEYVRVAQVQPMPAAPPVLPGVSVPERLKRPRELVAEIRYHYRHGGARAVWINSIGFLGKIIARLRKG